MSGWQHIHELILSIYLRPIRGGEGVNKIEIWNSRLGDGVEIWNIVHSDE